MSQICPVCNEPSKLFYEGVCSIRCYSIKYNVPYGTAEYEKHRAAICDLRETLEKIREDAKSKEEQEVINSMTWHESPPQEERPPTRVDLYVTPLGTLESLLSEEVINGLVELVANNVKTFGGEKTSEYNPFKDKPPMFAAGVDVKEVVKLIIKGIDGLVETATQPIPYETHRAGITITPEKVEFLK